jgi:hypothetical protein
MLYTKNGEYKHITPQAAEMVYKFDGKIDSTGIKAIDSNLLKLDYNSTAELVSKYFIKIESKTPVAAKLQNIINLGQISTDYDERVSDKDYSVYFLPKYSYPTPTNYNYNDLNVVPAGEYDGAVQGQPTCKLHIIKDNQSQTNIPALMRAFLNTYAHSPRVYVFSGVEATINGYNSSSNNTDNFYFLAHYNPKMMTATTVFPIDTEGTGFIVEGEITEAQVHLGKVSAYDLMIPYPTTANDFEVLFPPVNITLNNMASDDTWESVCLLEHQFYTDFVDIDIIGMGIILNIVSQEEQDITIEIYKQEMSTIDLVLRGD